MIAWKRNALAGVMTAGLGVGVLATTSVTASGSDAFSGDVMSANPRVGIQSNVLGGGLSGTSVAWGALALTNPDADNGITHYGYDTSNGGPLTQDPNEAFKTEPDKNVYLVFGSHHYLFQGHEGGPRGYVTRIDLDATDPAQRVSLVSDTAADGSALPVFDGITWDPYSHQLLLAHEGKVAAGSVFAITLDDNGDTTDNKAVLLPALGSGGFEGIQNDNQGNVWLVEDIGGAAYGGGKIPNSYVYRFQPNDPTDLTQGGTMRALQVLHKDGSPITAAELTADPAAGVIKQLHTYDNEFATRWVVVHTGADVFDAGASAAAADATPFKRPENGVFRPGSKFNDFYFTETGDTSALSTLPGRYGAVFRLRMNGSGYQGTLSPVFVGDKQHTGLDNIAFATADQLLVVEDAGDTLHGQRNALDSGYVLDVSGNGVKARQPHRWLAEGRDSSATYDALTSPGYNDGDNEITGIHVSDGDVTVRGILGNKLPTAFGHGWRVFWTQQHGDNITWEVHRTS